MWRGYLEVNCQVLDSADVVAESHDDMAELVFCISGSSCREGGSFLSLGVRSMNSKSLWAGKGNVSISYYHWKTVNESLLAFSQVNHILFKTKGCEGMEKIEDKGQTIYSFPKDAVKTEGTEFLVPYNDSYNL